MSSEFLKEKHKQRKLTGETAPAGRRQGLTLSARRRYGCASWTVFKASQVGCKIVSEGTGSCVFLLFFFCKEQRCDSVSPPNYGTD